MKKYYSPLRYPGGKARLAPFIQSVIQENDLVGIHYVEPYAGGAGVALSAIFNGIVSSITINDIDQSIYAFWYSVVNFNDQLCKKINATSVTLETWHRAQAVQLNKESADLLDLGFSTFFLNRTNMSGILQGGVIGGTKQQGNYKMNARFNKKGLIARIQKIGEFSDKIRVSNFDSLDLIQNIKGDNFLYMDPPYVNQSKRLYINAYTKKDHVKLAHFVQTKLHKKIRWITSYDNTQLIVDSYRHCKNKLYWQHNYSTSNTMKARELIFASDYLRTVESEKFL